MVLRGEPGVYHVISRPPGLGDIEKDFLFNLLVVRMHPGENQGDEVRYDKDR
jgi:hypothetical protein